MVDHALAPHLGGVGGEDRHNERVVEQVSDGAFADAVRLQLRGRVRHRGAGIRGDALPVLCEVGEERKEHEAADEGEGVVQCERFQLLDDLALFRQTTMLVDRCGSYRLDPIEARGSVVAPDDVPKQLSQIPDVRVLLDRLIIHWSIHAAALLSTAPNSCLLKRSGHSRPLSLLG